RDVTIMVSKPGYETVGSKDLTCEDWMVNTHTNADLSVAIQNALQTLLPQIHAEIREEQKSGDRHQPTSQQSSHRNHGHNNDRHGSDRRGGSDNHRSSNNNYSGSNNRNFGNGRDQRNRGQQSNRSANSGSQQSKGSSEGYSYPVCTTCGRRHPGECRRAA
nr:hypothetical protein [Tanacetum cinerariifolium]